MGRLWRWNIDGSPDSGFGVYGLLYSSPYLGHTITFLQGGKLSYILRDTVYRFNANGMTDSSFANAGKAVISIPAGGFQVNAIKVGDDGKIFYAAMVARAYGLNNVVGWIKQDGTTDSTAYTENLYLSPYDLELQQGKVLVKVVDTAPSAFGPLLTRLNMDGSVDRSFGINGKTERIKNFYNFYCPLIVEADGKILETGTLDTAGNPPSHLLAIVRYTDNGKVDSSFGQGGITTVNAGFTPVNIVAAQLADGKILLGGIGYGSSVADQGLFLVRLDSHGIVDPSFGTSGKFFLHPLPYQKAENLLIQRDGKFLVGLSSQDYTSGANFYKIARLNENGTPDTGFGRGGLLESRNSKFALLENEKILVASSSQSDVIGEELSLSMYLPDGRPDSTFGNGGFRITEVVPGISSVDIVKYFKRRLYVLGTRRLTSTSGAMVKFKIDYDGYCPADRVAPASPGYGGAIVDSIDPAVDPAAYPDVIYRLTGATTGSGQGSASGLAFSSGVTFVKYSYAKDSTVNCSFSVTVLTATEAPGPNLQVTVTPNPSAGDFAITLQSDDRQERIDLKLFDAYGTLVAASQARTAGETINYGSALKRGTYFLQAKQGNTLKVVQLLKL
jgi:uncharacterized delta-60 repeat protein